MSQSSTGNADQRSTFFLSADSLRDGVWQACFPSDSPRNHGAILKGRTARTGEAQPVRSLERSCGTGWEKSGRRFQRRVISRSAWSPIRNLGTSSRGVETAPGASGRRWLLSSAGHFLAAIAGCRYFAESIPTRIRSQLHVSTFRRRHDPAAPVFLRRADHRLWRCPGGDR